MAGLYFVGRKIVFCVNLLTVSKFRVIQAPVAEAVEAAEVTAQQAEAVLAEADTAGNLYKITEENATLGQTGSCVLLFDFYKNSLERSKAILRASDKVNPSLLIVESISLVVTYILCIS